MRLVLEVGQFFDQMLTWEGITTASTAASGEELGLHGACSIQISSCRGELGTAAAAGCASTQRFGLKYPRQPHAGHQIRAPDLS